MHKHAHVRAHTHTQHDHLEKPRTPARACMHTQDGGGGVLRMPKFGSKQCQLEANSSLLTGILVETNEPHPTQSKTVNYRPRNQATVVPERKKKYKKPELQADSKTSQCNLLCKWAPYFTRPEDTHEEANAKM